MTQDSLYPPGAAALGACAFVPDERAVLAERIAEALRGTGEVWLLIGERGSGRTALLDEAIARMPGPPVRLVRVQAEPDGVRLNLHGFVAQVAGPSGPEAAHASAHASDPVAGDALERAFEALAGDEPAVLVVDGADGLAAEVLRYIQLAAKSAPGLQVLFVALPGFRAVLERDEFAHLRSRLGPELVVPRLSDADAVRFVRHRLGAVWSSPVQPAEEPALGALVRAGRGLPGRLIRLLDRALAHGAEGGERPLTSAAVARATHELDHPHEPPLPAEAPPAPVPLRAPVRAAPDPRPGKGPNPRDKLAPPRSAPRRPALAPVAAALAIVGLVAGLGAWAVVAPWRGAPASPQASQAAALAPAPAPPAYEAARPVPPPPPVEQASPDAALMPAPARDAARPPPPPLVPPDLLAALLARGEAMLAVGDVSAARLLFERAAVGGDAAALRAAGRAYDPAVLARLGAVGIKPDDARAADYYGRAAALGDAEAQRLLRQLGAGRARR